MAPRPGPLMPYSLEHFSADSKSTSTPAKHLLPKKRPYSPGMGCLDSPAKRRLKATEGAGTASHTRSPLSASSNNARFASPHFHALLQGPDSPVKKLDFTHLQSTEAKPLPGVSDSTAAGLPQSASRTPKRSPRRTSGTRVRRSPRLSTRTSTVCLDGPVPGGHPTPRAESASPSGRASGPEPILIPRVISPPDPQSIHYPGFDIYQDPFTVLPTSASISSSVDDRCDGPSSDKEEDKENLPPRRKSSKKAANSATLSEISLIKTALLSPSSKRARENIKVTKPTPASPHPKHVCDYLSGTHRTPRERVPLTATSPVTNLASITPGRTPLGKEERKQMRRALEAEVDDFDGEDDP
ncbi:hypothetical protein ONZ51_g12951 [Trametes cubensis]|uniref:Uncharacterized protein n=1 Tax=Trametes cubensis TaxID=1111947 RepID=A0AAD7TF59_9APHY|nr:hypothetical protein ONZ51_g12951 [Trametes cubensis]